MSVLKKGIHKLSHSLEFLIVPITKGLVTNYGEGGATKREGGGM